MKYKQPTHFIQVWQWEYTLYKDITHHWFIELIEILKSIIDSSNNKGVKTIAIFKIYAK